MELNWIDVLLVAIMLLSILLGWRRGFLLEFFDLATWLASLLVGIRLYQPLARWVASSTGWSMTWTKPLAFLVVFFVALLLLRLAAGKILSALPREAHRGPGNKLLGVLPGLASGFIYATIAALVLIGVPLPEQIQSEARSSRLNNRLAGYAAAVESALRPVFDEAVIETLNLLTVQPESAERVQLPFSVKDARPRPGLEEQMLALVNQERVAAGLKPLVMNEALTRAARAHSADMLARSYFSHHSPEGKTAADRLRAQKIPFLLAGENLAFAPTVRTAHSGLMQSPGHRANILRPQFRKVGIGVMDAGARGIMVTQKFSN